MVADSAGVRIVELGSGFDGPAERRSFLRNGTLTPGVAGAWLPLSLPVGEALFLYYLVGKRRYRRHV